MSNNGFRACIVGERPINNFCHFFPLEESLLSRGEIEFIKRNNHVFKEDAKRGYPSYLKIQEIINNPEIVPWEALMEFEIQNELNEIQLTPKILGK